MFDVPLEEVKDPLFWWSKKFPIIAYLTRVIIGIPWNHIETERIFSIARIVNVDLVQSFWIS
jgi:hypothetical protein